VTRFYRWGPAAGIVSVVLLVVAFIVAGSSPDTGGGHNADIATYLAKKSNFDRNITAMLIAIVAVMFLVIFYAALRSRLALDVRFGNMAALTLAAGVASAIFLFMALAGFASSVIVAHDARPATLDPNFYRFGQDFGYIFWIAAGGFGAVAIFATAAAALNDVALPRWFGWVSIVCGILALGALFFLPMFAYALWILIAGIVLTMRTPDVVVTAPVATATVV
jgi:hypothetical protein